MKRMLLLIQCLLYVIVIPVFLAGCGGGSGDSGSEGEQQTIPNEQDSEGNQGAGGVTTETPVPDNVDGSDNEITLNESTPNSDNGESGGPDTTAEVSGPIILFADGGPAPGIPGGFIEDFRLFGIDDGGAILASAGIRGSFSGSVVWAGSAAEPILLYRTGDTLSESTPDETFASLVTGTAASDGSLAIVVNTQAGSRALVQIDSTSKQVLLRTGDTTEGPFDDVLDGTQTIIDLLSVRHSNAGLLVLTELSQETNLPSATRVWLEEGAGSFIQVIRSFRSFFGTNLGPSTPVDSDFDCRLYAERGDARNDSDNALFGLADTGEIVIDGVRVCGTSFSAPLEEVIARRDLDGQWETIVLSGSSVPGAPQAIYGNISGHSLSDENAQVLVRADLNLPDLLNPPENFSGSVESYWIHPVSTDARLISLQGEMIQTGDESQLLSGGSIVSGNALSVIDQRNNTIALSQVIDSRGVSMLLRGMPHSVLQPHASVASPGASSLSVVAALGTTGLPGLPDGAVFTALSAAELDAIGNMYFVGVVDPQRLNVEPERGLWRADTNGQLSLLLSENDNVSISGITRPLGALLVDITRGTGSLLRATDNGDLYLITQLGGASSESSALVRLPVSAIR